MKNILFLISSLLVSLAFGQSADEIVPEVEGMMMMGRGQPLFAMKLQGNGHRWTELGTTYNGYKLESYDKSTEALVLSREGKEWTIYPPKGKVKPAALGHDQAVSLFDSMISRLKDRAARLPTYRPLPAESDPGSFKDPAQREYLERLRATAKPGQSIYVVANPQNGVPMPLIGARLDYDKMPSRFSENLSSEERKQFSDKYQMAMHELAYNEHLARVSLGLVPQNAPGFVPGKAPPPGQQGIKNLELPAEFLQTGKATGKP